jgi:hypothetical protein
VNVKLTREELLAIEEATNTPSYKVQEIIDSLPQEYKKSAVEICKCYIAAERLHKVFTKKSKSYPQKVYDEALSVTTLFNALHRSTSLED